jgi:hypothetical protein
LPTTSGEFEWECLSLPKALCTMVKHSHAFKTVLSKLFQTTPCTADTPYNLVVYADEVRESVWGKQPPSCTAKVSRRVLRHLACSPVQDGSWSPAALPRRCPEMFCGSTI